jgi:3-methylcrotonyl-CoA carboxylase alpha subunit
MTASPCRISEQKVAASTGSPRSMRDLAVEVSQGQKVAKGQRLLTLEAMKMEHALIAPFDGTVAELNAVPGAQVSEGQLLVKVKSGDA